MIWCNKRPMTDPTPWKCEIIIKYKLFVSKFDSKLLVCIFPGSACCFRRFLTWVNQTKNLYKWRSRYNWLIVSYYGAIHMCASFIQYIFRWSWNETRILIFRLEHRKEGVVFDFLISWQGWHTHTLPLFPGFFVVFFFFFFFWIIV